MKNLTSSESVQIAGNSCQQMYVFLLIYYYTIVCLGFKCSFQIFFTAAELAENFDWGNPERITINSIQACLTVNLFIIL